MTNGELHRAIRQTEREIIENCHIYDIAKRHLSEKLYQYEEHFWYVLPGIGLIMGYLYSSKTFLVKTILSLGKVHLIEWLEHGVKKLIVAGYKRI